MMFDSPTSPNDLAEITVMRLVVGKAPHHGEKRHNNQHRLTNCQRLLQHWGAGPVASWRDKTVVLLTAPCGC